MSLPFQPWIWCKTNTGAHSLMNTYISASAWPSHLLCLSLKHKKAVTFHTNKARPHHLLCIFRTFLLELYFWILTVTVPDPGLNGNLASGSFGFLIEYPWSTEFDAPSLFFYCFATPTNRRRALLWSLEFKRISKTCLLHNIATLPTSMCQNIKRWAFLIFSQT